MVTPKLHGRVREKFLLCIGISFCLGFVSCSIQPKIPSVVDHRVESILRSEAAHIMTASEDRENFSKYRFLLTEFPRKDILGMSVGDRKIYISYSLASRALTDANHRWLLRQTVAHEIAHETTGHAKREGQMWFRGNTFALGASGRDVGLPWYVRFYNYSTKKELEADLKGLGYWNKLGWDCRIWIRILENFQTQGYKGDIFHPTARRLQQAENVCDLQRDENLPAQNSPRAQNQSSRSVN
jgi:predicted Zn-dependent protease